MEEYINNNTIIQNEISNAFKDSIICPLCLNILIDPVMCMNCQKNFCKRCIDSYTQKDSKCPNECSEPKYQISLGKNEILSKLKFKCKKCGIEFQYDEAQKHKNSCDNDKNLSNKIKDKDISCDDPFLNLSNPTTIPKSKLEKLTKDEIDNLKKKGNDVIYMTGKNTIFIFFINIVIALGSKEVGKTSLINT